MNSPNVVVVGSVALDTIETPHGKRERVLGGSATHFSLAARRFGPVGVVGVVGQDFPDGHLEQLQAYGIDTRGVRREPGPTFRWHGRYDETMNSRTTISVELGVFASFRPVVPPEYSEAKFVLLGNASPLTQRALLDQLSPDAFVMLDTMDLWINEERHALEDLLPRVGTLCINYEEALQLADETNLARAVRRLTAMGVRSVIVKKAEHGALLVTRAFKLALSAYLTEKVVDPTGAGDAFAGGFLGYLSGTDHTPDAWRRALGYGAVMGSFAVEEFGTSPLETLTRDEIDARFRQLVELTRLT